MLKFAHRGASAYAPENTIAAIKKAIDMGAEAIEIDVQLTKDRKLIVIHDYDLKRTTNGSGLVMAKTLEELQSLDSGSWYSSDYRGEKLAKLEEVIENVPKNILINIELKKFPMDKKNMVLEVLEVIEKYNVWDRVIISSFNHSLLKKLREKSKKIRIGVLFDKEIPNLEKTPIMDCLKPYSIHLNSKYLDEKELGKLKNSPYKIYSYTINDREIAKKYEPYGLDGFFTDYPEI